MNITSTFLDHHDGRYKIRRFQREVKSIKGEKESQKGGKGGVGREATKERRMKGKPAEGSKQY